MNCGLHSLFRFFNSLEDGVRLRVRHCFLGKNHILLWARCQVDVQFPGVISKGQYSAYRIALPLMDCVMNNIDDASGMNFFAAGSGKDAKVRIYHSGADSGGYWFPNKSM